MFILIILHSKAQNVSTDWANKIGGSNSDLGASITVDNLGYVYTAGEFYGTMDFDPGNGTFNLSTNGNDDIFLTKIDMQNSFIWAIAIGGTSFDGAKGVTVDNNGNIYLTGYFSGTVDFDPGPGYFYLTSSGGTYHDIFICKISSSGNLIWAKSIGATNSDFSNSIALDSFNNVYTTGYYSGTVDFDPGIGVYNLTNFGPSAIDEFVLKLDNDGNFIWAKGIGGSMETKGNSIVVVNNGYIYTTGYFSGTVDFDPSNAVNNVISFGNTKDAFILKLDLSGNFIWVKTIGGSANDIGNSLDLDSSANIYYTGSYATTVDFDPNGGLFNISSNGGEDIFISKLDQYGNFVWAQSIGGIDLDRGYSIDVEGNNIYLGGRYQDSVDFDPGAATSNLTTSGIGAFIANYNLFGNLNWAKSFKKENGGGSCILNSLKSDNFGNVFSTGQFVSTIDFNPNIGILNITSSGNSDIFIHKLKPCQDTYLSSIISACDSYTFGAETYYTSGTYFQTIPNVNGCDSSITIELTINHPTSNNIIDTACNEYTINNITYTNSGLYTQIINNSFGCDSLIFIDLTLQNIDNSTSLLGGTITSNANGASYQWLNCNAGYSPILGATDQSYIPAVNGDFAVVIYLNGCQDTSSCISVLNVEIIEIANSSAETTVYPNPILTFQKLNLSGQSKIEEIEIIDVIGDIVFKSKPDKYQTEIELEIAGVYFINIKTGNRVETKKIIVQK